MIVIAEKLRMIFPLRVEFVEHDVAL